MNTVIIGVGSNINPQENIARAKAIISSHHILLSESQFIETTPIGVKNQSNFLNGAFLAQTTFDRSAFNNYLKSLEEQLGRKPSKIKGGPRTIDLDIIVWNNEVVHPDFQMRDFVRNSVLELLPKLSLP